MITLENSDGNEITNSENESITKYFLTGPFFLLKTPTFLTINVFLVAVSGWELKTAIF